MANMYIGDQALGTVSVVLNTADATATAADILKDKTAYVGDKKVVGTHECEPAENLDSELATQDAKIAELQAALQGKAGVASEDLSAEMTAQDKAIASQDDLIAQIATALEGKTGASGGASVETSTVTIYDNYNLCFDFVSATILEGDVIDACYYSESNGNLAFDENNYLILNNVVKNSIITILMNDTYNAGTTTTGATLLMEYDFDGGGIHDFKTIFVFKVTDVSARIVLSYDGVA